MKFRRLRAVQRLRYEVIYSWPGWRDCAAFNCGFWPVDPEIAAQPDFAAEPNQIQLYAELAKTAGHTDVQWRQASVLELCAGRGGGLRYIQKRYAPADLIGLELTWAGVRHGRSLGARMTIGSVHRIPFPANRFDIVLIVDAFNHVTRRDLILLETRRILKPDGLFLVGDFFKARAPDAIAHLSYLAQGAGYEVVAMRDATACVIASLEYDHDRKLALLQKVPRLLRGSLAETLALQTSKRYREWHNNERSYVLAAFRRT